MCPSELIWCLHIWCIHILYMYRPWHSCHNVLSEEASQFIVQDQICLPHRVHLPVCYNLGLSLTVPSTIIPDQSLAALPLHKEEGSGTVTLLELFFSPEILGNMNIQILWPQHYRDMQARTTTMVTWHISIECAACSPCAVVSVSPQSIRMHKYVWC